MVKIDLKKVYSPWIKYKDIGHTKEGKRIKSIVKKNEGILKKVKVSTKNYNINMVEQSKYTGVGRFEDVFKVFDKKRKLKYIVRLTYGQIGRTFWYVYKV